MHRALAVLALLAVASIAACAAPGATFKAITQPLLDFGGNDTGSNPAGNFSGGASTAGGGTGSSSPSPAPGATRPAPGKLLGTVGVGISPRGLALDPSGRVWVAVSGSDMIVRLDGNNVAQRIAVGSPQDMAFDASGRAWVATSAGVLGFDATGAPLQGAAGPAAEAVAAGGGFVYASFPAEGVVRRYEVNKQGLGPALTLPGSAGTPHDLLVDGEGRLWAALGDANLVARYDNPAATPSTPVLVANVGGDPAGLAMNATGRTWAVGNSAIVEVTGGTASVLIRDSLLAGGRRLVFDPAGSIWVAANTANRLVRVTSAGKVAESATGVNGPWDVVADRQGDVWVSNEAGGTVMRFSGS